MPVIKQKGFTLIELLVVLVIISIVATAAFLAAGDFGQKRNIKISGQQFQNFLNLAKERALLTDQSIGIAVNQTGYQFFVLSADGKKWLPLQDELLNQMQWPNSASIIIKNVPSQQQVQIIINPEGEISGFDLQLYEGNDLVMEIKNNA